MSQSSAPRAKQLLCSSIIGLETDYSGGKKWKVIVTLETYILISDSLERENGADKKKTIESHKICSFLLLPINYLHTILHTIVE